MSSLVFSISGSSIALGYSTNSLRNISRRVWRGINFSCFLSNYKSILIQLDQCKYMDPLYALRL